MSNAQFVWYHDLKWDLAESNALDSTKPARLELMLSDGAKVKFLLHSSEQLAEMIDNLERAI